VWFRVAAGAVLARASHPGFTDPARGGQAFAVNRLPPPEIVAIVRSTFAALALLAGILMRSRPASSIAAKSLPRMPSMCSCTFIALLVHSQ
jgi:hypothetical protein